MVPYYRWICLYCQTEVVKGDPGAPTHKTVCDECNAALHRGTVPAQKPAPEPEIGASEVPAVEPEPDSAAAFEVGGVPIVSPAIVRHEAAERVRKLGDLFPEGSVARARYVDAAAAMEAA